MSYLPQQILQTAIAKGIAKTQLNTVKLLVLGCLGGAFIALGYLACLKVMSGIPPQWSGLAALLGAAVFPIGLIGILLGGGELITGNMMVLPVAQWARKISLAATLRNWLWVSVANLIGAMLVAWWFGHYLGLTEGAVWEKTQAAAQAKVAADFGQAFVSGIGCNWLVCLGVWLCYGAKSTGGKILGIWFPVMIFVLVGFQHVVANMFVIPAAIWGGAAITWAQFWHNMAAVYLGNLCGGSLMVGAAYYLAYRDIPQPQ